MEPISAAVVAIEIIKPNGDFARIEPTQGITNPEHAQVPGMELIQDDGIFQGAVVGIGSFGVIVAVVLLARDQWTLREKRSMRVWEGSLENEINDLIYRRDFVEMLMCAYDTKLRQGGKNVLLIERFPPPEGRRDRTAVNTCCNIVQVACENFPRALVTASKPLLGIASLCREVTNTLVACSSAKCCHGCCTACMVQCQLCVQQSNSFGPSNLILTNPSTIELNMISTEVSA